MLLTLNSTQEGHTYSFGSYFGFMGCRQGPFIHAQGLSYETIKEHSANFTLLVVFVSWAQLDRTIA